MSKALNEVEWNYTIHDKELLAIIRALEEWSQYLKGAQYPVTILTDHRNLEYFQTAKKLNRRQARWSLILAEFEYTLEHRPGTSMGKPDALSRRSDHSMGKEDNSDVVLLPPSLFINASQQQGHLEVATEMNAVLREMRREGLDEEGEEILKRNEDTEVKQGLLFYKGKIYIPLEHRRSVMKAHHTATDVGHPGQAKTIELITRNYWWPSLTSDVKQFIRECLRCQQTKTFPAKPLGLLTPNPIPIAPWENLSVDLIVGLPDSQGFDSILVIVDRFTKMIHALPTMSTITSEGVAKLYRDNVWKLHGLPKSIISDRGSQFASKFMTELNRLLGITTALSTAYHPQTDGQTERVNQDIEQYLRLFVNYRQDDWVDWLSLAEFTFNNRLHSSTNHSPFWLNTRRHPISSFSPPSQSIVEGANDFAKRMAEVCSEAEKALQEAADDMKRFYDTRHQEGPKFKVGDLVFLSNVNLRSTCPSRKLDDKHFGPFKITKQISPVNFELDLPHQWSLTTSVFHVSKLKPFTADPFSISAPPPPPDLIADHLEYEVEAILDSRQTTRGALQYLVKWKGYGREENSWEPLRNLSNAANSIARFHSTHPHAIRSLLVVENSP